MPYKDPEQRRTASKRHYEQNREYYREYRLQNREKQREYMKLWYEQNREKQLEYAKRRYQEEDPAVKRDRLRRYYQENRERLLEQNREYHLRNRAAVREQQRQRYGRDGEQILARKMWRVHGLWPEDLAMIYEAQEGRCYLCRKPMTLDEAIIEHDHRCCPSERSCKVCRRGLAHSNCNVAVGMADDDPEKLRAIADALEAAQAAVESRKAAMSKQLILDIG